jgi:hypothetical protein
MFAVACIAAIVNHGSDSREGDYSAVRRQSSLAETRAAIHEAATKLAGTLAISTALCL